MAEKPITEIKHVRLMIRVHIREISPFDVPTLQAAIQALVEGYPTAEVETSMLPLLPSR